jgi:two-component system heavy metal sensor histidine kinase CusS
MMPRTFKSRLTLLYTAIFASLLTALAVYVQVSSSQRAWAAFDEDLLRDADLFGRTYMEELVEKRQGVVEDWRSELALLATHLDASAAVIEGPDRVVFSTEEIRPLALRISHEQQAGAHVELIEKSGAPLARCAVTSLAQPPDALLTILLVRPAGTVQQLLRSQLIGLSICLPILIALAALTGHLFVRRGLRPVDEMATLAREISAGDLARRVPLPDSEGELRELALTLNAMLARLEESFARLKSFTADAAHELRTPIASVRGGLENALSGSSDPRPAIGEALEEIEDLTDLMDKLLLLAQADAGRLPLTIQEVDLTALVRDVVELAEALGGQGRIQLEAPTDIAVRGDGALLRRAIHNIVDNAIKYGAPDRPVRIVVTRNGIDVLNGGPPIPTEHVARLFDRFYRVDSSRSRVAGHGLGLSIVRSIAEAHGGNVEIRSDDNGTRVRLSLPGGTEKALLIRVL